MEGGNSATKAASSIDFNCKIVNLDKARFSTAKRGALLFWGFSLLLLLASSFFFFCLYLLLVEGWQIGKYSGAVAHAEFWDCNANR